MEWLGIDFENVVPADLGARAVRGYLTIREKGAQ